MTLDRNYLGTFALDMTSLQMTEDQRQDVLEGVNQEGGTPSILAAFVHSEAGETSIVPLGVDNITEDDMWQGSVFVQVTYELDSIDQDELRSLLISIHHDLKENGKARALAAREKEKQKVRNLVRDAEQAVRDAQQKLEELRAYAKTEGVDA